MGFRVGFSSNLCFRMVLARHIPPDAAVDEVGMPQSRRMEFVLLLVDRNDADIACDLVGR